MSMQADRVHAKLNWFAACERMLFALNPPERATDGDPPIDLQEAVRLADEALDELRMAFGIDRSGISAR